MPTKRLSLRRLLLFAGSTMLAGAAALGQGAQCPAAPTQAATPGDSAYSSGSYAKAEDLYAQALNQRPHDAHLAAALVRTWLHEGEIAQASAEVNKLLPDDPHSAILLTALAEVELRQGEPWLALQTLNSASAGDPCYARVPLIRSRIFRIDSMYASERSEIRRAYLLDPTDHDIQHAWRTIVVPANDIESIEKSIASTNDLDPEVKKKAEASAHGMRSLLSENSQTCQVLPTATSATLPLLPSMQDGKHIDGYRLDVQLPRTGAKLMVDTAASGLYVSRELADANGLSRGEHDPQGTVHVDSVHIGPLEFRDCMVGVSDVPFTGKADGFIGTDIFSSYLIALDHPGQKLTLAPLPPPTTSIPGDRPVSAEFHDYQPVYHRLQYLLVPVMLNNKQRRLFVLDSGIRFSTMTSEVAHLVSTTKMNFTNAVQTTSGSILQVYRDSFDFDFINLSLRHQAHILEFDPSAIEQNAGLQIGGMLGFDILHSLTMHLDYRDGLVKFESSDPAISPASGSLLASKGKAGTIASEKAVCGDNDDSDRPLNMTIEARTTGLLDSGQLKTGEQISMKTTQEWAAPDCRLPLGSLLYGHVTASATSKASGTSQLAIVIDHGDCFGHGKTAMPLRILGLVAPPGEFKGLHNAMPSQVSGGGRQITGIVASTGGIEDENLNPGGAPHTIHPGIVAGIPKLKLEPEGGPTCSTLLSSPEHSVRLGTGTEFILTPQNPTP